MANNEVADVIERKLDAIEFTGDTPTLIYVDSKGATHFEKMKKGILRLNNK
tara:strand:- start:26 stop:178 length:153 start_codon:yes stop_codon:yes gene_type:complete